MIVLMVKLLLVLLGILFLVSAFLVIAAPAKVVAIVADYIYSQSIQREKQIGYTLQFSYLPESWIQGMVVHDISAKWQRAGIPVVGVNYYTIGKVNGGKSTRFDPSSPYFQSWFGGYVVKLQQSNEWSIHDHFQLAEVDQKGWLSVYGDPESFVETDPSSIQDLGPLVINGRTGRLYRGGGWSDTDIGSAKKDILFLAKMDGFAEFFHKSNSALQLSESDFYALSNGNFPLDPYQKIYLDGYIVIFDIDKDTKVVLYANAAKYVLKDGTHVDNFPIIKEELHNMLEGVRIEKL